MSMAPFSQLLEPSCMHVTCRQDSTAVVRAQTHRHEHTGWQVINHCINLHQHSYMYGESALLQLLQQDNREGSLLPQRCRLMLQRGT
jgi:hypothetical protein